jgi:hypothetical protein
VPDCLKGKVINASQSVWDLIDRQKLGKQEQFLSVTGSSFLSEAGYTNIYNGEESNDRIFKEKDVLLRANENGTLLISEIMSVGNKENNYEVCYRVKHNKTNETKTFFSRKKLLFNQIWRKTDDWVRFEI